MKSITQFVIVLIFILFSKQFKAQHGLIRAASLNVGLESALSITLFNSLDSLFEGIDRGKIDTSLIDRSNFNLNFAIMSTLKNYENKDTIKVFYKKQLINLYPVSDSKYFITIAYIGNKANETGNLSLLLNLIATKAKGNMRFSIPLNYVTSSWKTKTVGNITYHFNDNINIERANIFNKKNTSIAQKLGVKPEKFNFYLCDNYQQIIRLLGFEYELESNGKIRDGFGVMENTIFSIMNNEDFSHDILHYYSEKIRTRTRNNTAEEGVAYLWGNAYYTSANGEMISQKKMVDFLNDYLQKKPDSDLLEIFTKKPKIYSSLALEISVKSVISGVICNEIEKRKGVDGIKTLLNCGSGDENYFKCVEELIKINKTNFNEEIKKLVIAFK
ncbi:MAG: hypothetical protein ABIP51_05305 [Bacteroidia bacterium]